MIFNIPTIGVAVPTDADWGRLYLFDDTEDAGLIMPPRSYYFRDFFSGGWTQLAMGLIHCATEDGGETDPVVNETKASNLVANLFHFGLTESGGGTVPVAANPEFLGIRGRLNGSPSLLLSGPKLTDNEYVCIRSGGAQRSGSGIEIPLSDGISASPFTMMGLKFIFDVENDRLHLHFATEEGVSLADEDENVEKLTTFLNDMPETTSGSDADFYITNLSSYKSYYIYWPYMLNRLKLHCVGAIKYA